MITIITGEIGSGKTLVFNKLVGDLKQQGITCKVNNEADELLLRLIKTYNFGDNEELPDIALDEGYIWYDCRHTMTKKNRLFAALTMKLSTNGHNVIITAPKLEMVDKRVRRAADTIIECRGVGYKENDTKPSYVSTITIEIQEKAVRLDI